ncbi:pyridoxine 5'-phosphate oxidase C-terminal domain-containing protein [Rhizobium viscosum]|uniref:pyridoxine 5'-phosphate oxidase C-terminal domain-containing protein n=1 Tax=Rhizobium viscosum TaxID=1673 RepID=UPI0024839D58|nr:pyridoxine 5'-phosphate oxidase C-terminal domain-containing protein [Rhizobium viscosum]
MCVFRTSCVRSYRFPHCRKACFIPRVRHIAVEPELVAPHWQLFIVMPHEVEFWQGAEDRRHHRLLYRREKAGWQRENLWP